MPSPSPALITSYMQPLPHPTHLPIHLPLPIHPPHPPPLPPTLATSEAAQRLTLSLSLIPSPPPPLLPTSPSARGRARRSRNLKRPTPTAASFQADLNLDPAQSPPSPTLPPTLIPSFKKPSPPSIPHPPTLPLLPTLLNNKTPSLPHASRASSRQMERAYPRSPFH